MLLKKKTLLRIIMAKLGKFSPSPCRRDAHSSANVNVFGPLAVTSAVNPDVAAEA